MFVGRKDEIADIEKVLEKTNAFVIICGPKHAGKTALLHRVLDGRPDATIYFECTEGSYKYNLRLFSEKIKSAGLDIEESDGFRGIFRSLSKLDKEINVVMDEYPNLTRSDKVGFVDSVLQGVVDEKYENIRLFLVGSDIPAMDMLERCSEPLFGRRTLRLEVTRFGYKEAAAFYPNKSPYDKAAFYSVFGGSPFVNENIDPKKSLKENIESIYLSPAGAANLYMKDLLYSCGAKTGEDIEPILSAIGGEKRKFGEIRDIAETQYDYVVTNALNAAIKIGLLDKIYPVNKRHDVKKARYEIRDNVLRFYYAFVFPNRERLCDLSPDEFYEKFIEPDLTDYLSKAFQKICIQYLKRKIKSEHYNGIVHDCFAVGTGSFYFENHFTKEVGEYPVAVEIEACENAYCYDVYLPWYTTKSIDDKYVMDDTEEVTDNRRFLGLPIRKIGFITVGDFFEACKEFAQGPLIDGEELYR